MLGHSDPLYHGRMDQLLGLPEMHVGVPRLGAIDAWRRALTEFENMKLTSTPFFGGVADIAEFFDQI